MLGFAGGAKLQEMEIGPTMRGRGKHGEICRETKVDDTACREADEQEEEEQDCGFFNDGAGRAKNAD